MERFINMARMYNTFDFTGELGFAKEPLKVKPFDSGWNKHNFSFAIIESKTNKGFVSLEAGLNVGNGKPNIAYTGTKGLFGEPSSNNVQVPWEDRLNPSIVDSVPDYRKTIIDLTPVGTSKDEFYNTKREIYNLETKENPTQEDKDKLLELYDKARNILPERKEFINTYDAIQFFMSKLEEYKGRKFRVKGNIEKSHWNEKFYTNFVPSSIELVSDEERNKLGLNLDLFFTKGAVDEVDFAKEKVIRFDTYILSRDNAQKKDVFFPQQTVLNASKLDLDNPKHTGRVELIKKMLTGKSNKNVYHMAFEGKYFRGADEVEFTEKDLTPLQKECVELGINKIEDFKPKGGMLGETIEEFRVTLPLIKKFNDSNDFSDGIVESTYEVEDLTYVAPETNQSPKPKEIETTVKVEEPIVFDELEDLL